MLNKRDAAYPGKHFLSWEVRRKEEGTRTPYSTPDLGCSLRGVGSQGRGFVAVRVHAGPQCPMVTASWSPRRPGVPRARRLCRPAGPSGVSPAGWDPREVMGGAGDPWKWVQGCWREAGEAAELRAPLGCLARTPHCVAEDSQAAGWPCLPLSRWRGGCVTLAWASDGPQRPLVCTSPWSGGRCPPWALLDDCWLQLFWKEILEEGSRPHAS